jgi:hypothetical protein
MAFEAVQLHGSVAVAALAEILVGTGHAAGFLAGVAFNAAVQAVLSGSNAVVNCFVTLMF